MKSLERLTSLDAAIAVLGETKAGLVPVDIRLVLADGRRIEGQLLSVSAAEVCLRVSGMQEGEDVSLEVIRAMYVARPRSARTLVLGVTMIAGGTGAMVVYSLMPWVVLDATDWQKVFAGVWIIGVVLGKLLTRSAGFRTWWTRWVPLYES